jgi:hypothetical protein
MKSEIDKRERTRRRKKAYLCPEVLIELEGMTDSDASA